MITERNRPQVDVKQAVRSAIDFVRDIYVEEQISNLGLEEVSFDDGTWSVTVGFSRSWARPKPRRSMYDPLPLPGMTLAEPSPEREYKVVKIDAGTGTVVGMEIRDE